MHNAYYMQNCTFLKSKVAHCINYAKLHNGTMNTQREENLAFIEKAVSITGLSYSRLAIGAGVAESTINRYVRDDTYQGMSQRTRDKIAKYIGYRNYKDYIESRLDPSSSVQITGIVGANLQIFDVPSIGSIPKNIPYNFSDGNEKIGALYTFGEREQKYPKNGQVFIYRRPEFLRDPLDPENVSYLCLVKLKDGRSFLRTPEAKIASTGEYILAGDIGASNIIAEVEWFSWCFATVQLRT